MFLVIIHYLITIVSSILTEGKRSDANNYFVNTLNSSSWFSEFGISTTFIDFLIYPLIHFFKLNYLSIFLIFGTFGIIGFLILYELLLTKSNSVKIKLLGINVIYIILFLPSYHLWMSNLGKDSIVFMLTMILLNNTVNKTGTTKSSLALIVLLTFIRPYIGVFLFIALAVAFLFEGLTSLKRVLLFFFGIIFGLIISFQLFKYLNIDISSFFVEKLEWLSRYANSRKEGSFLDPRKMNVLEKTFSYLYRPLFYDARGIAQILVSVENFIFLLLTLKFLIVFKIKYVKSSMISKVLFLYCLIFLLVQSYFIYNLGLVNRQKYMILPLFLYIFFDIYKKRLDVLKTS